MNVLGVVTLDRKGQARSFSPGVVLAGAGDIPAGIGIPIVVGTGLLALFMIGIVFFLYANWKAILRAIA